MLRLWHTKYTPKNEVQSETWVTASTIHIQIKRRNTFIQRFVQQIQIDSYSIAQKNSNKLTNKSKTCN